MKHDLVEAEGRLNDTLAYLWEAAAAAAAATVADANDEDRAMLDASRQAVLSDGQILRAILPILKTAEQPAYRIDALNRLLAAAICISSRAIVTAPVTRHVKGQQANRAQKAAVKKREESSEERLIRDAITDASVGWDRQHHFKLAGSIVLAL